MTAILASAYIRMRNGGESAVPDCLRRLLPLPAGVGRGATAPRALWAGAKTVGVAFVRLLSVGLVTLVFVSMVADLVRAAIGDGASSESGRVLRFPRLEEVQ